MHHSNVVKAWVADRKAQIELFHLPSHCPQPKSTAAKRLNADLQQDTGQRVAVHITVR